MDIKIKLKERLLEIPINDTAFREKHRLANHLKVKLEDVEPLLNELVEKNILKEKIEYKCPTCRDRTVMDQELLEECIIKDEDNCFECDNCINLISPIKNKTGYVFYNIKDKQALINW